ncbi:hypothetical protein AGRA3207_006710 [Actinomadura graeca]|uniref:Uncharacterized protein n=1 Tax=Actinomadura graeca TaxID=2750812 RepID=A0ABX8R2B5_9ACTN|nr:hypothetical protein [Actinomadura graeca]QXJ25240.1 hypothetical protein AGRA3207_006710 [Actinomadura graeca]
MAWSWRLERADGRPAGESEETFSTQADAESWLGENWRALRADEVEKVTLLDGESAVYGMSLDDPV